MSSLDQLLSPRSIAVVGASSNPESIPGRPIPILIAHKFAGTIYPINPQHAEVNLIPTHASLTLLPKTPDVAMLLVRAESVVKTVEEAVAAGIPYVAVYSSGFNETVAGRPLAQRLSAILKGTATRLLGPNTQGFFDVDSNVPLTFSPVIDPAHRKAPWISGPNVVLSQSGGLGFGIADHLMAHGLGVRAIVSTGNELDLEVTDFLDHYAALPDVRTVTLFIESLQSPRRFLEAAVAARSRGVGIVVAKVGTSEAGRAGAQSHTGKVTGSREAYSALFDKAGVVTVRGLAEIVDAVGVLQHPQHVSGGRIAVISTSGGSGAWLADRLTDHGLDVPILSVDLQAQLRGSLPAFAAVHNPVDITGQAVVDRSIAPTVKAILESDEVDAVVLSVTFGYDERMVRDELLLEVLAARTKPVVLFSYTTPAAEALAFLERSHLPWYEDPDRAAAALSSLVRLSLAPNPTLVSGPTIAGPMDDSRVRSLLVTGGVNFNPVRVAIDSSTAAAAAEELGFPVVMKVVADSRLHKVDVGGVVKAINRIEQVSEAFATLRAVTAATGIDFRGVSVERQLSGHEVMLGALNWKGVGPVIALGPGGTGVELVSDRVYVLAPLSKDECVCALNRIDASRAWRDGYRNLPPANMGSLVELVQAFSEVVARLESTAWREVECNPVIAGPDLAAAVDFRFIPAPAEPTY